MTAPDVSTMWPASLAAWLNESVAIKTRMEITPKNLNRRMSVPTFGTSSLAASFLNVLPEFFVAFDLIRIQHRAYLTLSVLFDRQDFRTRLSAQLANLSAAFFEDFIYSFTLLFVEIQVIVNSVYVPVPL